MYPLSSPNCPSLSTPHHHAPHELLLFYFFFVIPGTLTFTSSPTFNWLYWQFSFFFWKVIFFKPWLKGLISALLFVSTPSHKNRNRTMEFVIVSYASSGTNLNSPGREMCSFSSARFSWVEDSSTASTPDGSSPGAMSWPGHFLSEGLVLIKAWASRNAPYSPNTASSLLFYGPSPLTPPVLPESLRHTPFFLLPPIYPCSFFSFFLHAVPLLCLVYSCCNWVVINHSPALSVCPHWELQALPIDRRR